MCRLVIPHVRTGSRTGEESVHIVCLQTVGGRSAVREGGAVVPVPTRAAAAAVVSLALRAPAAFAFGPSFPDHSTDDVGIAPQAREAADHQVLRRQ